MKNICCSIEESSLIKTVGIFTNIDVIRTHYHGKFLTVFSTLILINLNQKILNNCR